MMVRKISRSRIEQKKDFFNILWVTNVINRQSENNVWYMDYSELNVPLY